MRSLAFSPLSLSQTREMRSLAMYYASMPIFALPTAQFACVNLFTSVRPNVSPGMAFRWN